MKTYLPILLIVGSLLGLGALQFQWLKAGLAMEKQRFDREVLQLMQDLPPSIEAERPLYRGLLSLQQYHKQGDPAPAALRERASEALRALVQKALETRGIELPFSIALTESIREYQLLQDKGFKASAPSYRKVLGGAMARDCRCQLALEVQLQSLLPLLLGRLSHLLIATGLALLLLLGGFLLLIRKIGKARKLNEIKNDFINNLTHELKTPIFSIGLLSRLLRDALKSGDAQKGHDYLNRIEQENQQLRLHAEKVLELASLEQPKYQLNCSRFALGDWLAELAKSFEPRLKAQGGQLSVAQALPADTVLWADREHLSNAVLNLLDNALKYGGGQPQVELSAQLDGKALRIAVADKGPGISPQHHRQVFDKFFRLKAEREKGFGLGLSYVRQTARLHGGQAGLHSPPGVGALFWIRLPAERIEHIEQVQHKE